MCIRDSHTLGIFTPSQTCRGCSYFIFSFVADFFEARTHQFVIWLSLRKKINNDFITLLQNAYLFCKCLFVCLRKKFKSSFILRVCGYRNIEAVGLIFSFFLERSHMLNMYLQGFLSLGILKVCSA